MSVSPQALDLPRPFKPWVKVASRNKGPLKKEAMQMSPHVNNFVTDLVEMAKAMDELPKAQTRVRELEAVLDQRMDTIMSHELHILDLKQQVETANSIIRTLEVARDDAEMRFLEADDKMAKALAIRATVADQINGLFDTLNWPKPGPVSPVQDQGQSADSFPSEASTEHSSNTENQSWADGQAVDNGPSNPPGQSEADPTVSSNNSLTSSTTDYDNTPQSADGQVSGSSPNVTIVQGTEGVLGKYHAKRYIDYPYYVSEDAWVANGGTHDSYWEGRDDFRAQGF